MKSETKSYNDKRKNSPHSTSLFPPISNPRFLIKHFPPLSLSVNEFQVNVGGKDAKQVAIATAIWENTIRATLQLIQQLFDRVHIKNCFVLPCFYREKTTVTLHLTISFRFYQFVKFLFLNVLHSISANSKRGINLERGEGYA